MNFEDLPVLYSKEIENLNDIKSILSVVEEKLKETSRIILMLFDNSNKASIKDDNDALKIEDEENYCDGLSDFPVEETSNLKIEEEPSPVTVQLTSKRKKIHKSNLVKN